MLKTYSGSCHCGAVRFEADLDLSASTYRCNCSICRRNRFWVAVAKPEGFRLLVGEGEMTEYLFNTKKNQHFFCKHCGVRAFGVGNETPIGKMYGVNVGCLEGVTEEELSKVPITYIDGLNNRWQDAPAFFSHLEGRLCLAKRTSASTRSLRLIHLRQRRVSTGSRHRWSALEKENPPATGFVVRVVVMKHR